MIKLDIYAGRETVYSNIELYYEDEIEAANQLICLFKNKYFQKLNEVSASYAPSSQFPKPEHHMRLYNEHQVLCRKFMESNGIDYNISVKAAMIVMNGYILGNSGAQYNDALELVLEIAAFYGRMLEWAYQGHGSWPLEGEGQNKCCWINEIIPLEVIHRCWYQQNAERLLYFFNDALREGKRMTALERHGEEQEHLTLK